VDVEDKIPEEGRNLSHTAKKSAKYRNPKGSAKYFEPYKNAKFIIVDEDVSPEEVEVPVAPLRSELNPKIWTTDNELRPEVRQVLLDIANSYFKSLDLSKLKVNDIYFTGSLANYGWTDGSDIDLHLIVDYGELGDIDFLEDYLYLKKKNWIDKHNISIYGFEVEPFAKDEEVEHDYKAIYSVLNNRWVVAPRKDKPTIDFETIKEKSATIMNDIDRVLDIKNNEKRLKESDKLKNKLGGLRNIGLSKSGEYSNENLIYKTLRRSGYLDKLGDAKDDAFDSILSLNENIEKSIKPMVSTIGIVPIVHTLKVQKNIVDMNSEKINIIKEFINFVCEKLKMESCVNVFLRRGRDEYIRTTASYVPSDNTNHIRCGGRALVDILRSIAHELVHSRQRELNIFGVGDKVQNIGGRIEDKANSVAGVFIKDFTNNYGYDHIYDF
jgi:predicted nucleotidyltransferase